MSDAGRLHAIERWTLIIGAILTIGAFVVSGRELGLAVSIGAGMMALNAIAMRRVGEKIWSALRSDTAGGKARPARAIALFNLKMAAVLLVVYVVVRHLHVSPVGLVIGLSSYPLAAVAVALTYVAPPESPVTPAEDHHG